MSIFITMLAFADRHHVENAKLMVLISSTIAALLGLSYLKTTLKKE